MHGSLHIRLARTRHVPFEMTRLHLGFELGEGNRRDGPDANAGFAGERLEIGGHFRFLHAATPAVDIEDVFFRAPCEAESACGCRGGSELDGPSSRDAGQSPHGNPPIIFPQQARVGATFSYRRVMTCASAGAQNSLIFAPTFSNSASPPATRTRSARPCALPIATTESP
jgi:hypothetical protein